MTEILCALVIGLFVAVGLDLGIDLFQKVAIKRKKNSYV